MLFRPRRPHMRKDDPVACARGSGKPLPGKEPRPSGSGWPGICWTLFALLCPVLLAQREARTDRVAFPPGGTLHLSKSIGELTIEGWDEPAVEITTIKSVKVKGD